MGTHTNFRDHEEFGFQVHEVDSDGRVVDIIALAKNIRVARAAFFAILPERAGRVVLLMHRSRVILDSRVTGYGGVDPG